MSKEKKTEGQEIAEKIRSIVENSTHKLAKIALSIYEECAKIAENHKKD